MHYKCLYWEAEGKRDCWVLKEPSGPHTALWAPPSPRCRAQGLFIFQAPKRSLPWASPLLCWHSAQAFFPEWEPAGKFPSEILHVRKCLYLALRQDFLSVNCFPKTRRPGFQHGLHHWGQSDATSHQKQFSLAVALTLGLCVSVGISSPRLLLSTQCTHDLKPAHRWEVVSPFFDNFSLFIFFTVCFLKKMSTKWICVV